MSRLTATIRRLDGSEQPIGPAEPADRVGQGITLTGSMPGGQQSATLTVARDPALRDLDPFDELIIRDTGNVEVWRGYGVEYPTRDGEGPEVEINATGWSGYLKDNTPGPLVAVDRSFDRWEGPSLARRATLLAAGSVPDKAYTASAGQDGLTLSGDEGNPITGNQTAEVWYRCPVGLGSVGYQGTRKNLSSTAGSNVLAVHYGGGFPAGILGDQTLVLDGVARQVTIPAAPWTEPYKWLRWAVKASALHTPAVNAAFMATLDLISVHGNHGIPLRDNGTDGMKGVLASDVIAWALRQACPLLTPQIAPTKFIIPHLVEDPETAEDLIQKANATEMFDWGVWGRTFRYRPPGTGQTWVVRSSDPGVTLNDAGPQGEDTYTRAIVTYQDTTGTTRKAGYPGAIGVDTESPLLTWPAPTLANRGRERTLILSLSATSTSSHATQVGQAALQEYSRRNLRGDATLTGTAQTILGETRNVAQIQAGDQLIFADREWIPRQIVDLTYTEDDDTSNISLDSTPTKLDALMERMGVINESTGL